MCVTMRRDYRVAQMAPAAVGAFAAAAVLNSLSPADWSVSQEVEVAVTELATALVRAVDGTDEAHIEVTVHANHVEVVVGADSPQWITESVRLRPRRPFESSVRCSVERRGPAPPRPVLWPELGLPRGHEDWAATYAALGDIVQSMRGGQAGLGSTLDAIARGVVRTTCFTMVAVNLLRPDGDFEVVAVEGDDDARATLLGVVERAEHWHDVLATSAVWGTLRFLRGDDPPDAATEMTAWSPPSGPPGEGWNAEDALLAPLYAADGTLIGVLSVDLPGGSPRPAIEDLSKLELFAEHAAMAIERNRPRSENGPSPACPSD